MSDPDDKTLIQCVKQLRKVDDLKRCHGFLSMVTDGYKVTRVTSLHYQVQKPNAHPYNVTFDKRGLKPSCDCPARKECKHIQFLYFLGEVLPQLPTGV